MTPFSELLRKAEVRDGELKLDVPDDWLQGRTLFGGLQTALALSAMRSLVAERPLRSLQTNFIGPLAGHIRAQAAVLRSGKNTTQVEARLLGEQGLATQVMGIFGSNRASEVAVRLEQPQLEEAEAKAFPFLPGLTPNFTQHFTMRLRSGNLPFSGRETGATVYELDLHDEGPANESHVVALADVVPPLGLSYLKTPTFGSTLSWMLELLTDSLEGIPLQAWRVDTELVSAKDGYTNQSSTLWSPAGEAIALSRQCMMVFG